MKPKGIPADGPPGWRDRKVVVVPDDAVVVRLSEITERYMRGETYQEIAKHFSLSPSMIASRIQDARVMGLVPRYINWRERVKELS